MTATIICPLFHGAKNVFVPRHFILRKLEDLPRQARDTHTGKVEGKRETRFLQAGEKTALFEPFIYKMHYFTKTGSGRT